MVVDDLYFIYLEFWIYDVVQHLFPQHLHIIPWNNQDFIFLEKPGCKSFCICPLDLWTVILQQHDPSTFIPLIGTLLVLPFEFSAIRKDDVRLKLKEFYRFIILCDILLFSRTLPSSSLSSLISGPEPDYTFAIWRW